MIRRDYYRLKEHLLSRMTVYYRPFWMTSCAIFRTILDNGTDNENNDYFFYQTSVVKDDIILENIFTAENIRTKTVDIICIKTDIEFISESPTTEVLNAEKYLLNLFNIDVNKFIKNGGKREYND